MHYPHAPHRSDYFTVFRQEDWKVVYHYFPTANSAHGHYQLFQLRDDPYESTNLAATRPAELQRLMRELTASLERHAAQYPVEADGTTPRRPQLP